MDKLLGNNCAPSKEFTYGSCFNVEQLKKITKNYNKEKNKNLDIIDNKQILVNQLKKELSGVCKNQLCWIKQKFIKNMDDDEINDNTFMIIL